MNASPGPETLYCAECGRPSTAAELARFGNVLICPACKNNYAQKLREGGAAPAAVAAFAGFWIRLVGYLIDAIILGVVGTILQLTLAGSLIAIPRAGTPPEAMVGPAMGMIGLIFVLNIAIAASYEAFFVANMGATPGKLVIGVKVVRPDGSRVDLGRAFGRYFAKILSALILLIGYIMIGFDSQKRGLHDMICDTRVIKSRN